VGGATIHGQWPRTADASGDATLVGRTMADVMETKADNKPGGNALLENDVPMGKSRASPIAVPIRRRKPTARFRAGRSWRRWDAVALCPAAMQTRRLRASPTPTRIPISGTVGVHPQQALPSSIARTPDRTPISTHTPTARPARWVINRASCVLPVASTDECSTARQAGRPSRTRSVTPFAETARHACPVGAQSRW